jgi:squalene-hopene/tetraprenyl-beta-curcumene cyclase
LKLTIDSARLLAAYDRVRSQLLAERVPDGHWIGQLSTSALSTATAVSAFSMVRRNGRPDARFDDAIDGGIRWLAEHQNDDGGWGDTDRSHSNIATTMLAVAAFHLVNAAEQYAALLNPASAYIESKGGIVGLRQRYGTDKTFAVPILTNYALAGLVSWDAVPALPFELACLPQQFYRFARMPVVSYAIPALVAIGQARYFHCKPLLPWMRLLRWASIGPSLRVLRKMQPESGGYLEAAPLTSFVVMSLAASGQVDHPVVELGVKFLLNSRRADGSLPIDTNLATWTTTLAINALGGAGEDVGSLDCWDWLLSCQHGQIHPFTGAEPGGWGWTDLSGAVPDADDTPGALLALAAWRDSSSCGESDRSRIREAAIAGVRWLLNLQNSNGGWPTFCRGWGKLPFDRSGADLTAHVLRALKVWPDLPLGKKIEKATAAGFRYLGQNQRPDGSWIPLWFGNQDHAQEENPVYGTAKVLLAYRDWRRMDSMPAQAALNWLCAAQNDDGGWGGGPSPADADAGDVRSSVEETALAVEALVSCCTREDQRLVAERGLAWLVEAVEANKHLEPSPIGFYFAKLWYYERLYPSIFTMAALGQVKRSAGNPLCAPNL